jgi:hypothetical protein
MCNEAIIHIIMSYVISDNGGGEAIWAYERGRQKTMEENCIMRRFII